MVVEVGTIDWYEYLNKFGLVEEKKKGRRKAQKHRIMNVYAAFDIETSTMWMDPDHSVFNVHSFMYVWQFAIEDYTFTNSPMRKHFSGMCGNRFTAGCLILLNSAAAIFKAICHCLHSVNRQV